MIKVVAFDMVGVLVSEKDIQLTMEEEKLERMFGKNINDSDYLIRGRKIINKDPILIRTTKDLINKIYRVKDNEIFKKTKQKNPNVKIVIATNHVSFIRNYIGEALGVEYLDDIIISAEIHKIKPHADFYEHILNKYNINPEELLFLDDNIENIEGATKLGINIIKVNKDTSLFEEVCRFI